MSEMENSLLGGRETFKGKVVQKARGESPTPNKKQSCMVALK